MKLILTPLLTFACLGLTHGQVNLEVASPDNRARIAFALSESGMPSYSVTFGDENIILPSKLGFRFADQPDMIGPFEVAKSENQIIDESWKPVWGQRKEIDNKANELKVTLVETQGDKRTLELFFRAYDDGVAFRYHFPKQPKLGKFNITEELTTFEFSADHTTWWVESLPDTYERNYNETGLSNASDRGASTPVTLKTSTGTHVSLHEANLTDWAGMKLKRGEGGSKFSLQADLVPWFESNIRVKAEAPHSSPWRTIQLADNAGGLITSYLILNLNDPCAIEDTSWIKPAKFMGIWWGCITGTWNWEYDENPDKHGATTERAKRYIDACVRNQVPCLLIEGWNKGWEGGIPGWGNQSFTESYPDFDIEEVTRYGKKHGVTLVGHHETGGNITNYENQLPAAFQFYNKYGVNRIKSGYVSGDIPVYTEGLTEPGREHHHGQFMVNHHQKIIELAAKHKIMMNPHEPIKATGISRTWPNFVAREGARGGEFNHFIGNPPSQTCTLPFTRLLAGPMDYTPGLFDGAYTHDKRFGTRSQQLALYVCFWSPLQMLADFYQAYDTEPATQFIRNVPVGIWNETLIPQAEVGRYLISARRSGKNWFVGAITNEEARTLELPLDFLEPGKTYTALLYTDGDDADYERNPYPVAISEQEVNSSTTLTLKLARGGGAAIEIYGPGEKFTRPSGEPGRVVEGTLYHLRAKHSGRLATAEKEFATQLAYNRKPAQRWNLKAIDDEHFLIINQGRALTRNGEDNGSEITLLKADANNPSQHWKMRHIVGTWFHIASPTSGKLIDVKDINYSDGGRLHLWEHAHSPNQIWSLEDTTQ